MTKRARKVIPDDLSMRSNVRRDYKKSPLTEEEMMKVARKDISGTDGMMPPKRSSKVALAGIAGALLGLGLIAASNSSTDQLLPAKKKRTSDSDDSTIDDDPDDHTSYFETSDPDDLIEEYRELEVAIAIKQGRWAKKDPYHEDLERYIFDGGFLD